MNTATEKLNKIATTANANEWAATSEQTMFAIDLLESVDLPTSDRNIRALENRLNGLLFEDHFEAIA